MKKDTVKKEAKKSVIDAFAEQLESDMKKSASVKDEVKDTAEKDCKPDKKEKDEAIKKDSKEDKVNPKKEAKEKPKAESKVSEDSKDKQPKDKSKDKVAEDKDKVETKSCADVDKEKKASSKVEYGTKGVYTVGSIAPVEETAKSAQLEKVTSLLQDSYNLLVEKQDSTNKEINTIKSTVNSLSNDLLPLMEKIATMLPEVKKSAKIEVDETISDPEEVAKKSADLEDKQHAEVVKKSANTEKETFAKDKNSTVVDDVVKKSAQETIVETQTETPAAESLTDSDYLYAAIGNVNNFYNRMNSDIHKGLISESQVPAYNNRIKNVLTGKVTTDEAKSFIDYALGK